MPGVSKAINDKLFEAAKQALKGLGNNGKIAIKLRAIIAAKEHGIAQTSRFFKVSRPSLLDWIKRFEQDNIQGLELRSGRGRKPKTDADIRENIRKTLLENPNMTGRQVQDFLFRKHNVVLKKSAINNLISEIGFSYITPRPRHYKSEQSAQDEFKKNSKKSKRRAPTRR